MNTEKLIDEIYKVYPMCRVEITPTDERPSEICITVRFYYHGDYLGFGRYVYIGANNNFCENDTTAIVDLIISRIKKEIDIWRSKWMKKLYSLDDINGNAYALIAYTRKAMEESGFTTQEIDEMIEQAKSSDYHHLLIVCQSYIKKCNDM